MVSDYSSGLGSTLHVMGEQAAHAWRNGRVILWGSAAGAFYADNSTCGDRMNILCHLRRESNCSLAHAAARSDTIFVSGLSNPLSGSKKLFGSAFLPQPLFDRLSRSGVDFKSDELRYWWRAQTAAYFARLNDEALAHIRALRSDVTRLRVVGASNNFAKSRAQLFFPLPHGVTSAHVRCDDRKRGLSMFVTLSFLALRHGDKGIEMDLVDFPIYVSKAEEMVRNAPFSLQRALFVSTEDPDVLKQAADASGVMLGSWAALFYDLPRSNDAMALQIQNLQVGPGHLTRLHFMQVRCD